MRQKEFTAQHKYLLNGITTYLNHPKSAIGFVQSSLSGKNGLKMTQIATNASGRPLS